MDNVTMFGDLISYLRICVNDRYFILKEYPDRISLKCVYFLHDGLEERYKRDYIVLTSEQLLSLFYKKHDSFVVQMDENFDLIEKEGSI